MKGTIRAVVAALAAAPVLALAACGSGTNTAHRAGMTAPGHQPAAVQRAAFAPDPGAGAAALCLRSQSMGSTGSAAK